MDVQAEAKPVQFLLITAFARMAMAIARLADELVRFMTWPPFLLLKAGFATLAIFALCVVLEWNVSRHISPSLLPIHLTTTNPKPWPVRIARQITMLGMAIANAFADHEDFLDAIVVLKVRKSVAHFHFPHLPLTLRVTVTSGVWS